MIANILGLGADKPAVMVDLQRKDNDRTISGNCAQK